MNGWSKLEAEKPWAEKAERHGQVLTGLTGFVADVDELLKANAAEQNELELAGWRP